MIRVTDPPASPSLAGPCPLREPVRLRPRPGREPRLTAAYLLLALLWIPAPAARALPIDIPISEDGDDGEEVDRSTWNPGVSPMVVGWASDGTLHEVGVRYVTPQLSAGDSVLFARLRFSARGGAITDSLTFTITGSAQSATPRFSQESRPSLLPRTEHRTVTTLREPWLNGASNTLFYYSDDLSGILNEIMATPGWGVDSSVIALCLRDDSGTFAGPAYIRFSGFGGIRWSPTLQVCRTLDEAFACHERLGRPTDSSVLLRFTPLVAMDVYVEYSNGGGWQQTPVRVAGAGVRADVTLESLAADAQYTCRLHYRRAGRDEAYRAGPDLRFHTQRAPGSAFTFTTVADEHTWCCYEYSPALQRCQALYERTLANSAGDEADFHFSLGDFSMTAYSRTMSDATDRCLFQRNLLDRNIPSVPFYLVMGNHEGEQGWLQAQGDSVPVWAERARRETIPNPAPSPFYDGCPDSSLSGEGVRETYYSWEWGDALFVVLDPFSYTTEKPFDNVPGMGGGWNWTLGKKQYDWLYQVLSTSDRHWKIVLLHHLTSGVEYQHDNYGRGGIEVAKWRVAHRPTFEWGGEDEAGTNVFASRRPGWTHGPIHDLLRQTGVSLVIHGHDHFCAFQNLDGIAYVLCPQPGDEYYTYGALPYGGYTEGVFLPNSGHLRFHVTPTSLAVDYVRAYLEGDGENGEVEYRYIVPASSSVAADFPAEPVLRIVPNPATGSTVRIRLAGLPPSSVPATSDSPGAGSQPEPAGQLRVFDAAGRLRATLYTDSHGVSDWNLRDAFGHAIPSGVYWCRASVADRQVSERMLIVR